ncbi:6602_t:CDS:1 [Paraglomus brasilianum]|uniref:6602_t:CDS:1 n=1 Tax=Paraglomus brasilianum TaxID=144538 RepID=A0A9N9B0C3_9GLOM|nr:6602_t:CDS:1 [Paraglomus brasilianum]
MVHSRKNTKSFLLGKKKSLLLAVGFSLFLLALHSGILYESSDETLNTGTTSNPVPIHYSTQNTIKSKDINKTLSPQTTIEAIPSESSPTKTHHVQPFTSNYWPWKHETIIELPVDPKYGVHVSDRSYFHNGVPMYKLPSASSLPSSSSEKYIAYLPHSQFNNQRISLENAILLARYTNRTLIIPPLFLGRTQLPWKPFDVLYSRLQRLNKTGDELCSLPGNDERECLEFYNRWTTLRWDEIFGGIDLFCKEEGIRIIWANSMSLDWIKRKIHVKDSDIHYLRDGTMYGAKVYDDPKSQTMLGVYAARLDVDKLKSVPHKLLYFESTYGIERVLREKPANNAFFNRLIRRLTITHQAVITTANKIVSRLGGQGKYIGVHIRGGDSFFNRNFPSNLRILMSQLHTVYNLTTSPKKTVLKYRDTKKCLRQKNLPHPPLYVATDLVDPRHEKASRPLFRNFSCVVLLDDFGPLLKKLDNYKNKRDKLSLKPFLIPMVDMLVASQGSIFVGTPGSTFSAFAERMHETLVKQDDEK